MSTKVEKLLVLAHNFEKLASESFVSEAKKKEKKKLDPKAKVRNRGTVCVPASSAKDKKDHFPINDIDQARNALARVHQYSSAPSWYNGSLKGLQDLVSRKVHAKYPSIGKSDTKKKSSSLVDELLSFASEVQKYAQEPSYGDMSEYELAQAAQQASQQDHPGIGKVPAEVWLKGLSDQGKIPGRLYQSALSVLRTQKAPTTSQTPSTAPQSAPARPGIPFRSDVLAAQKQFNKWNKQNQGLLPSIQEDGKLGNETRKAFQSYRPGADVEEVVKDLSEQGMTWNTRTPKPSGAGPDPNLGF